MMELLARLADNFWMKPQWGSGAAVYDNPLDVEFTRDLEPSIMRSYKAIRSTADFLWSPTGERRNVVESCRPRPLPA